VSPAQNAMSRKSKKSQRLYDDDDPRKDEHHKRELTLMAGMHREGPSRYPPS
jgi:hypothetical protein